MPGHDLKRWLFVAIRLGVVAALFIGPCAFMFYSWRDTTPRGPLVDPSGWPEPIRDLHADMQRANVDTDGFEVYLVDGRPGDYFSSVLCRMPDSSESLDFLSRRLELKPIAAKSIPKYMSWTLTLVPSDWWASSQENTQFFANGSALELGESTRYLVARDDARKRIYIHYLNVF